MPGSVNDVVGWIVRHRSRLPAWANRLLDAPARNPDGLLGRIAYRMLGSEDAPTTEVPSTAVRVYIAPTNYSGQGFEWSRALERADPAIGARNMSIEIPGGYAFRADTPVPITVNNGSRQWQQAEWDAVRQFSHVLVEAERPMFGSLFERDLAQEVQALEESDVSVAFLCHGTDIRSPRRHAELTPWSPYPDDPRTDFLQTDADANMALLERFRRPTFVSTPDLLLDVPWARWCPVVVDAARFATDSPVLATEHARIVHSSSSAVQKGSHHIEPALRPLIDAGKVDLSLVSGVKSERIPSILARADIVLDQFRAGSYGVAACEAMAAGRVVVGHVLPFVRDHIETEIGLPLPIVEATPDTLRAVVEQLLADPAHAREIAARGPAYVEAAHSGERSAAVLIDGWVVPSDGGDRLG